MDPTTEQILAHGAEARRLRGALGLSAREVAEQVTERIGRPVSLQSVTGWERGEYGPKDAQTAQALDDVLEAGGSLLGLLGVEDTIVDRLTQIEDRLLRLEESLAALARSRRGR